MKASYKGLEVNIIYHEFYYEIYSDDYFVNEIIDKEEYVMLEKSGVIELY